VGGFILNYSTATELGLMRYDIDAIESLRNDLMSNIDVMNVILYGSKAVGDYTIMSDTNIFVVTYNAVNADERNDVINRVAQNYNKLRIISTRLIDCHDPEIISPRLLHVVQSTGVVLTDFVSHPLHVPEPHLYDFIKYNNDRINDNFALISDRVSGGDYRPDLLENIYSCVNSAISSLIRVSYEIETNSNCLNFVGRLADEGKISTTNCNIYIQIFEAFRRYQLLGEMLTPQQISDYYEDAYAFCRNIYLLLDVHTDNSLGITFKLK
jgi:predicted nucleotidyltransferase